jgi:hypothetical protein
MADIAKCNDALCPSKEYCYSNCDENNWEIEEFYSEVKTEIQKL